MQPISAKTGGTVVRVVNGDGQVWVPDVRTLDANAGAERGGINWMGIINRDARSLKGVDQDPLIPGWLGALLVGGLLAWGWSRDGDHRKIKKALGRDNDGESDDNDGADIKADKTGPDVVPAPS